MSAEIIVGGAIGAATLYFSWRRIQFVRAYWRYHKRAGEFERAFREARDELSTQSFRAATADDRELVALLDAASSDQRGLESCGFNLLGDIVTHAPGQPAVAIFRAFVDPSHTTCAILGVGVRRRAPVFLRLNSYAGDEMFATHRGVQRGLADVPFVHRQDLAADLPHAKLAAQHHAFAQLGDAVHITNLDELVAQLVKFRAQIVRWREAQPPDVLLDADLRSALGDVYAKVGKAWARRLRGHLPQATARRL